MGKILLTCVLALVFGFGGATIASVVLTDNTAAGVQGPTGLTGAAGAPGKDGADGADGERGERGPRGLAGKAGKDAAGVSMPTDLGEGDCAGKSVSVITSAKVDKNSQLQLTKAELCIVTPPKSTESADSATKTGDSSPNDSAKPSSQG